MSFQDFPSFFMSTSSLSASPAAAHEVGRETLSATLSAVERLRGVALVVGVSFLFFAEVTFLGVFGVFGVRGVLGSVVLVAAVRFPFIGVAGTWISSVPDSSDLTLASLSSLGVLGSSSVSSSWSFGSAAAALALAGVRFFFGDPSSSSFAVEVRFLGEVVVALVPLACLVYSRG